MIKTDMKGINCILLFNGFTEDDVNLKQYSILCDLVDLVQHAYEGNQLVLSIDLSPCGLYIAAFSPETIGLKLPTLKLLNDYLHNNEVQSVIDDTIEMLREIS